MKSSIRWVQLICLLLLSLSSACGPTEPIRTSGVWEEFGQSVVDAGERKDVNYLVKNLSFSNPDIGKWVIEKLHDDPNIQYAPPSHEPQESELIAVYTKDVELFLRSYEHLFNEEIARVTTSQPHDFQGIESRSVVIWFQKDGKYHGMYIAQAVQTTWGIKVNDWTGQKGDLPWKQTANLVRDNLESCVYPESIDFTYQWEQQEPSMSFNELFSSPGGLLVASILVAIGGVIFLVISDAWTKAIGDDTDSQVRRSRRYRNLRFFDQLNAFYGDSRNMPVSIGIGGIMMILSSIIGAIVALVWFIVRAL
jgi:hypothetical protein